jgi:hypothetical protein
LLRNRWSIKNSWLLLRDVKLREDAHRFPEANGVRIVAMFNIMAINALRLEGIWSVPEGIAALAYDVKGLLRLLGWGEQASSKPFG